MNIAGKTLRDDVAVRILPYLMSTISVDQVSVLTGQPVEMTKQQAEHLMKMCCEKSYLIADWMMEARKCRTQPVEKE